MKQIKNICLLFGFIMSSAVFAQQDTTQLYSEPYRPQYHFSPKQGWIGDPSGFVYYQNMYHMYWWGKVTSTDLVHYKEVSPKVMTGEDRNIRYFTGSVVVDKKNTASFGENALIANYTMFDPITKNQSQGISYSDSKGERFQYYKGNPVLDIGSTEFRDPTVIWHEATNRWIMVVALALEKKVRFYSSTDLKQWTWMSDFGPAGDSERSWECPDLFQLPIDGDVNNKKWVLLVSVNWAREQYFIGDFDGNSFKPMEGHPGLPLYVDHGMDYYASRVFQDYDNTLSDVTTMGWVAYWDYAGSAPSTWGKGFWSIPRNLELKSYPNGLRMIQKPFKGLEVLRGKEVSHSGTIPQGVQPLPGFQPKENVYELDLRFKTDVTNVIGFNLCVGEGRKISFTYDTQSETLLVDRTHCTDASIPKFNRISFAQVTPANNEVRLHFFVDKSSIELFANDGKEVFTLLTYPSDAQVGIETHALRKGSKYAFKAWKLTSIWK